MKMENKDDNQGVLKGYNMLLYFAGSMVMYEPTQECVVDFWKKGVLKQLPVKSMNPLFINAASQLRESCEDVSLCLNNLQKDYKRLFASDGASIVPSKGSVYTGGQNSGVFKKPENVSEFYDSYGWVSKLRGRMDDDHLGIELLFLTRMIDKYLVLDDEPCRKEMRNEIRRFIDTHLLTWLPRWNELMQEHASTLCYKGIGTLIHACVEDIKNLLSVPVANTN
jgi:TorA maturation chaperone TorD